MALQLDCEVVTVERVVYRDKADMVIAPGIEGQLGILPRHVPLLTALKEGELVIRRSGEEDVVMAIGGGFMEVLRNRVVILADSAERAEEIDENRAQRARERALKQIAEFRAQRVDPAMAEAALRRSLVRLKVAQRRRRRSGPPQPSGDISME